MNHAIRIITLLFSIAIHSSYIFANSYFIDKIKISEGISDNIITNIEQDYKGFIWLGTEWGLNRFDGKNFKIYKSDKNSENAITQNGINKILSDSINKRVWIATKGGGLNYYDYNDSGFKNYPIDNSRNGTSTSGITDLCFSNDGNLWIATYQEGIRKLFIKDDSIAKYNDFSIEGLKNYRIKSIADDLKGNLYIGHWGEGFTIFNYNNNTLKHFASVPGDKNSLPGNEVMDILIDSNERIWLATHKGLALLNDSADGFIVFKNNPEIYSSISKDDIHSLSEINGDLWIGTWGGGVNLLNLRNINITNPELQRFDVINNDENDKLLSSPSITDICKDKFGNIWLATHGGGVNIINHNVPYFRTISSRTEDKKLRLSHDIISSVAVDKNGNLYAGALNGVIDIISPSGDKRTFDYKNSSLPEYNVLSLHIDNENILWAGVDRNGLLKYNEKTGHFEKINIYKNSDKHYYITSINNDGNENLCLGTNDGVIIYNKQTGNTTEIDVKSLGLKSELIRDVIYDNDGNLWIASTLNGMLLLSPELNTINLFNTRNGLSSNNISSLFKLKNGDIVASTLDGIVIFSKDAENNYSLNHYSTKYGLNDCNVKASTSTNENEIWLSTNGGISKLIINENRFINYYFNKEIKCGTFSGNAVAAGKDGIIYFGSVDGVCCFNSRKNIDNIKTPAPAITSFSVYDKSDIISIINESLPLSKKYKLKHFENTIKIEFSLMDFAFREQGEFLYTLSGFENIWHETSQNSVTFQNLPPGNYKFSVKGKSAGDYNSGTETNILFTIMPPLWLTWQAKLLYILLAVIILYYLILLYKKRLDDNNKLYLDRQNILQSQRLNEERINFFTNITHELRTPLTLILSPVEELLKNNDLSKEENHKLKLINNNARSLYSLINRILEFRKSETLNKELHLTNSDIKLLINEIVSKFDIQLNKEIKLITDFNIENNKIDIDIEIITTIVENLISNAIKYTDKGEIRISLYDDIKNNHKYVNIEIKDTGMGIPKECLNKIFESYYQAKNNNRKNGTGIGLALVKSLANLHKAIIKAESEEEKGSVFTLSLSRDNIYDIDNYEIKKSINNIESFNNEEIPLGYDNSLNHYQNEESLIENTENQSSLKNDKESQLILITEDNDELREYIVSTLCNEYNVISASDGVEGLELATERIPDIIISDIMMPKMEGTEFCNRVKSEFRTCHIPFILLTAKDSAISQKEGYGMGADSYITKPFNIDLLKARIENLLENRKKISKYYNSGDFKKSVADNSINTQDAKFVSDINDVIYSNINSDNLNIGFLAESFNMSYSSFTRKVKAVTGFTVNEVIRKIKMKRAEELLLAGKHSISEIAEMVGYNSLAAFREAFKNEFGVSPSAHINNIKQSV